MSRQHYFLTGIEKTEAGKEKLKETQKEYEELQKPKSKIKDSQIPIEKETFTIEREGPDGDTYTSKVEVITNPSARYNAEGSGGIINIVMKKGKTNGLNGSLVGFVGDPETYGFNSNINYKTDDFNVFSKFSICPY